MQFNLSLDINVWIKIPYVQYDALCWDYDAHVHKSQRPDIDWFFELVEERRNVKII
jgi:hypothetical protein